LFEGLVEVLIGLYDGDFGEGNNLQLA